MSNSRFCLSAALLLALGAGPLAHAQEELSEQQFLERIDGNLPEIQRFEAAKLEAEAELLETQQLAPLALSYEREEIFVDGEGVALKNAISLGWSVDVSGRRGQREESARFAARALEAESQYGTLLVTIDALGIYKRAARARLRVASLASTRAPLATLVEDLKNRAREGDASGIDLTRFELELAEHDDLLTEASSEQIVAETELAVLLGVDAERVGANDDFALPSPALARELQDLSARSDLLATHLREDSGKALQAAASRWWIPALDFSVGYLNTDLGPGTGPGADIAHGYVGMISADLALFGRGKAERMRGEARIRQARAERQVLERRVQTEVRRARTYLLASIERARSYEQRQLVQTAALVQKTRAAYEGGEASSLELRDAYATASASHLHYIELRYQCSLAELALWSAAGSRGKGETK